MQPSRIAASLPVDLRRCAASGGGRGEGEGRAGGVVVLVDRDSLERRRQIYIVEP